uniref:Glutaredoxin domain-containing protein n=1 Tax=Cryptomonas curvata TaxID=233186 RepID=A0A7S0LVD6_9CRYP|mmetsp:Transcript_12402/g.26635  ORF Transcript_12402/g.26635 Transcript_12402/m.26635 type:complete len:159 (+) Transcript_12402:19-495(+)
MLQMRSRSAVLATYTMLPAIASAFFSPGSAFVVSSRVPALSAAGPRIMLRGGFSSSTKMNADLKGTVTKLIDDNTVMVFSKTYCPYCTKAKKTLDGLNVKYQVLELDGRDDGAQIQDIMGELTGARSVPRVFIKGKFVGGGDDVVAKAASGELQKLLA